MNYPINKKVIIRTNRAGVFYGTLAEYDAVTRTAELHDTRRIWYWNGAASLTQIAMEGIKNHDKSKLTMAVDTMQVMEVIEILPCTNKAITDIEAISVWKK